MAPRSEHGSALSMRRAFVVHFAASPGAVRRRFRGRVEHLSSGESAQFSSLEGLLAFVTRVIGSHVQPPGHGSRRALPARTGPVAQGRTVALPVRLDAPVRRHPPRASADVSRPARTPRSAASDPMYPRE